MGENSGPVSEDLTRKPARRRAVKPLNPGLFLDRRPGKEVARAGKNPPGKKLPRFFPPGFGNLSCLLQSRLHAKSSLLESRALVAPVPEGDTGSDIAAARESWFCKTYWRERQLRYHESSLPTFVPGWLHISRPGKSILYTRIEVTTSAAPKVPPTLILLTCACPRIYDQCQLHQRCHQHITYHPHITR